ncbi:bromodomain associated domain protein [Stemphylium lycopersici]|uniref:Transcription initiation factor TFIID subunit 8 n=1 Tax=Stemphylium lycopersici TaxID=183478 RepID=A0A364NFA1_STELY|nr:bromodomain associated domain protein [Stemphylium lycopersici]
MKRAHAPQPTKRRVVRALHHTQPLQHITDPISAEFDSYGESKDFFDEQLRRAIAIQCRSIGFESARPDALEEFRALVDSYMTNFLAQVRTSMTSSRRTETVAHDWVYALASSQLGASAPLDQHFDTGEIPPSLLQPYFAPPAPPEAPPPDTESLLGPELSGKADKETRPYIPNHFPAFPSKHTYTATPVFTHREHDPRKIREKATEEGISAEQSLRKLMAAQKAGVQKQNVGRRKRSRRMKESDRLWQAAMTHLFDEENQRENEEQRQAQTDHDDEDDDWNMTRDAPVLQPTVHRNVNLEEGVHVNYEHKYWRKSAGRV